MTGTVDLRGRAAFRLSNYDTPFRARPNTYSGRWHTQEDGPTQYLCLEPTGAWTEAARAEGLRTEDELALLRTRIWVVWLDTTGLADYSTFDAADRAGFPPDALVDEDHARCQVEGARLRSLGYSGVVAPSAACSGGTNVTLFGARYLAAWGTPARLSSAIQGAIVARGAPEQGITSHVRHLGEQHAGLAAYRNRQPPDAPPAADALL